MATIPSKRLPKWIAIFRSIPPSSPLEIYKHKNFTNNEIASTSYGKILWMRGVKLVAMHVIKLIKFKKKF